MWKLIWTDYNGTEIWETRTSYLICRKYERFFKFVSSKKEAFSFYEKISA